MNENMSLEELKQQVVVWQQQVIAIQQRIKEIEKETSHKQAKKTPWQLAEVGTEGFFFDADLDGGVREWERYYDTDLNCFEKWSVAKGFANTFSVMIQLRQCEGAGEYDRGCGWLVNGDGGLQLSSGKTDYELFPPFPSKEKALAAARSVGIDRIVAAYKFLASGE